MRNVRTRIGAGGRVVIPAAFRRALGIAPGDEAIMQLDEGAVRILTPAQALKRAQGLIHEYLPKGANLAAELIAERRRESRRG